MREISAATGRKEKGLPGGKGGSGVVGLPGRTLHLSLSLSPPPATPGARSREQAGGEPRAEPRAGRAAPGETLGGCSEFQKRGIWQARGGGSVFVNAGLLLYIMYFPVYNKEGDYNNFTSAHSWPVLTLGICDALFLYKRPGLGLCFLLLDFFFIYFFLIY